MKRTRTISISIFALGLLAGSAVGVAAQDAGTDPLAPSAFSGEASVDGPLEAYFDPETGRGVVVIGEFNMDDPRASGTLTQIEDGADIEFGGLHYGGHVSSIRIANDGGAWVGTKRLVRGAGSVGIFNELVGEGGYEGLSLFIFETGDSEGSVSKAFIVPSDIVLAMPPPPPAE